jgi:hypothetical protein
VPRSRGLFSRITNALGKAFDRLGDFFGPGAEPAPVPPPAPPPPPPPSPPILTRENAIWRDVTRGTDRFDSDLMRDWFELYRNSVEPLQLDEDEFYEFWRDFLKAFYLTTGERGHIKRDTFYRRLGVRKRDFGMDWQEWRELKRGTP